MDEPTDRTDRQHIRLLMDRYEGPLLQYAVRFTGTLDAARDVVQDTFLRLWQRPPDSDDHSAQWLFTVCRNRAIDIARKERRMKPFDNEFAESRPDTDLSPADAAARGEAISHASSAVAELPANQQEVIRLKFQNGFSYKEIAGITGLSVTNVGYLIHTGVKTLRSEFQALGLLEA